ncbi:structural constituent of cytoskeleton [Saitoella complicata NRRL Y-17804]|uniref:Actin-related protein 2/3 complex subunit n=1 Tax=Saitoella complicata (strain BCRC 22490 / CBS 7301 / JCM 7358 / NBRC 10748 / NRRL Y-17804) TaxID=698492 RepID=A0A0E9NNI2_SAICN|nr:structural constituent of cytoskeleton [Saitoella complicata NRRL Y-17804]ODQ51826.1 structural constituent of cytoskeleton [Saitoella complicata NRRL Y-17804]GAO51363.1 hypothetical protein G7K_5465-t1 [Saitoella complicata NRRL Y-17804]
MSAPESIQLNLGSLTAHAFNGDRTQVAISANSNTVEIYQKSETGYTLLSTLTDHDKLVTSIDWSATTNRIVTCSQDRNAYVWTQAADGSWKPTLVLLRINRAATFVRWSPSGNKFAVASGARLVAVCYFEPENDWWVSKHLKKPLRSTALTLDWHPNNVLLAVGGADGVARVMSAFVKDVDAKPEPSVWGARLPFGTVCGEFENPERGWVHGVAFSPSGDRLAFAAHDSGISVVSSVGEGQWSLDRVKTRMLPFLSLIWISEQAVVAAGHDCQPVLFSQSGAGWELTKSLDDPTTKKSAAPTANRMNAAFNMFREMDLKGKSSATTGEDGEVISRGDDTKLATVHQNTITSIRVYEGGWHAGQWTGDVRRFSTSGHDGRLCVWTF